MASERMLVRLVAATVASMAALAAATARGETPGETSGESGEAAPPVAPGTTGTPGTPGASETSEAWGGPMSQHVYLDAETGVEAVQLRTFFADFNSVSAGFLPTAGIGATERVGAGLRLGFLTLGLRGRVALYDDPATVGPWQIWSLDAELGVRVPLHRVEPHLVLAGGYSSFGGFRSAVTGLSDGLDLHGVDLRLGGGVDYWVTRTVSLGLDLDGELLVIARPGVSVRDLATAKQVGTLDDAKARVLEANGSSVGTGLSLNAVLGVHF